VAVAAATGLLVLFQTGGSGAPSLAQSTSPTSTTAAAAGRPVPSSGVTPTGASKTTKKKVAPSAPPGAPLATVTIAAVGDTELGTTPVLPADPATYLDPVKAALAAPIVFGNLEGTLTDSAVDGKCAAGSTDCFAFRTPTTFAGVLRQAGFTVLNSANNHSHDFGDQGVVQTSAALAAAGIAQAGLPGQIAVVKDGTVRVAFVDFAPYDTVNNLLDLATARTLIQRATKSAALTVVYMHAGAEGVMPITSPARRSTTWARIGATPRPLPMPPSTMVRRWFWPADLMSSEVWSFTTVT
jgi:hypothetical protein